MMRSIRWRLVISYVLLTLLTVSVLGTFTYALLLRFIEEQEIEFLRSNAEDVARQAAPFLQPQVQQSDLNEIANTTAFLGNVRVKILDDRQKVLVDSGQMTWGEQAMFEEDRQHIVGRVIRRSDLVFNHPIVEDDNLLGFVELMDGPNFGADILRNFGRAFLLAATGSVLLAVVVALVMARRLTMPLVSLTNTVNQMEGGDLTVRASDYGKDEIGLLARQFNQMAKRLETSFATLATERDTLRRFIGDASHELRTPITALKNFNELLLGKAADDPEARVEFLTESDTQLDRLEWITTNLLNISRLESGLTPLVVERFEASEFLSAIASPFKIPAEAKEIRLEVTLSDPTFKISADRSLIGLALNNLLDNAIKFTPHGGHVQLGTSQTEDKVQLWVGDNGEGIDSEDLPHIFERFYRGRKTAVEGSGLGLAMVESVVNAHGGEICVKSELGIGSQFVIELPDEVKSSDEDHPAQAQKLSDELAG